MIVVLFKNLLESRNPIKLSGQPIGGEHDRNLSPGLRDHRARPYRWQEFGQSGLESNGSLAAINNHGTIGNARTNGA